MHFDGFANVYIRQVEIRDVRCLESVTIDFDRGGDTYAGWTVIAGPNASGKTTLLRAMALACVGPSVVATLQESAADWVRHGVDRASVALTIDRGPRDALYIPSGPSGEGDFELVEDRVPFSVGMEWVRHGMGAEPMVRATPRIAPDHAEHGPWIGFDHSPGWFVAGFGAYRRLAGGSTDAQRLSGSARGAVSQLASLFRDDVALAETMTWLERLHLLRLEGREGAAELLDGVLGILDSGLLPEHTRVVRLDADGLWVDRAGVLVPLQHMSDGYQTVAGLVIDLLRQLSLAYDELHVERADDGWVVRNEGVVLIDEGELHLHPSWQRRFGSWMKRHFPRMQFIVTTHSPFICQSADVGGLIHLRPGPRGTEASKLTGRAFDSVVNGTADDVLLSELFELPQVRSDAGGVLLDEIAALEARVLAGGADASDVARLRDLKARVPASSELLQAIRALDD